LGNSSTSFPGSLRLLHSIGLHLPLHQSEWIFIFLVAAVITVIPISLGGGLGTREIGFRKRGRIFFT
jgi:hypothetical protein